MLDFDPDEEQRIERANQIFLRLRKDLNDREAQFAEKDVKEAAQSAQWLREIIEQHPGDWEQAFEDALAEADLPEEDKAYLQKGVEEAEGFLPFAQRNLRRLEEAAPDEREQATSDPAAEITRQNLMCGVAAGLVAGGVMMGNFFYFGFGVGMSRKAECW
jgi:hypothetical protein